MGYIPPGARTERLGDDDVQAMIPRGSGPGLRCEEVRIPSEDGVMLAGLVVREKGREKEKETGDGDVNVNVNVRKCVIMYLQGSSGFRHFVLRET